MKKLLLFVTILILSGCSSNVQTDIQAMMRKNYKAYTEPKMDETGMYILEYMFEDHTKATQALQGIKNMIIEKTGSAPEVKMNAVKNDNPFVCKFTDIYTFKSAGFVVRFSAEIIADTTYWIRVGHK